MPTTLFVLATMALCATILAIFRVRHPVVLGLPIQMVSWLAGELAVFHIVAQAGAGAVLVGLGALDATIGRVGLALLACSVAGLAYVQVVAHHARAVLVDALASVVPAAVLPAPRLATLARPFHHDRAGIEVMRDVPYGDDRRQRLDIYRPKDRSGPPRPVLLYFHGGAWVFGNKKDQGLPLLHEAVRHGYVAVTANYRLAPRHRFPAALYDVKAAIAWVREHIAEHGGDPSFVATSGGSAGGHLAALAALTPNRPALQPRCEQVDTAIAACVPFYGAFDFTDRDGIRGRTSMIRFLGKRVMPTLIEADRAAWEAASPMYQVGADAPPFFVVHGELDVLLWREEARAFVDELRAVSSSPVLYAELPGAQHAFDLGNSVRSAAAVQAVLLFLDAVRATGSARPTALAPGATTPPGEPLKRFPGGR